jgi:hypothetical protein
VRLVGPCYELGRSSILMMSTLALTGPVDMVATAIPLSTPDVKIARLHVDPETKCSTSLVRFPGDWGRSVDCFYAVHEEIIVLEGELAVSGVSYTPGVYGFIPTAALRFASSTPGGCLALAWFGGIPLGLTEDEAAQRVVPPSLRHDLHTEHLHTDQSPLGPLGTRLRSSEQGSCWLVDGVDGGTAGFAVEVLHIPTWKWTRVEAGAALPNLEGRTILRITGA